MALCGRVDQGGDLAGAAPGEADAGPAVAVVAGQPRTACALLLLDADLMAHGAKAHPVPDDLGRAEPGFAGDAAGENGLSGLRAGLPLPASGSAVPPGTRRPARGADGDQAGSVTGSGLGELALRDLESIRYAAGQALASWSPSVPEPAVR